MGKKKVNFQAGSDEREKKLNNVPTRVELLGAFTKEQLADLLIDLTIELKESRENAKLEMQGVLRQRKQDFVKKLKG